MSGEGPRYNFSAYEFGDEIYVLIEDQVTGEIRETSVKDYAEIVDYSKRVWSKAMRVTINC